MNSADSSHLARYRVAQPPSPKAARAIADDEAVSSSELFIPGLQARRRGKTLASACRSTVSWAKMQLSMLDGLCLWSRRRVLPSYGDHVARSRPVMTSSDDDPAPDAMNASSMHCFPATPSRSGQRSASSKPHGRFGD